MQYLLSVLMCLLTTCMPSLAWYQASESSGYSDREPNRRSMGECTETGGECLKNYQCCNSNDFCMVDNTNKFGFGVCKARYNALDAYLPNSKFGFKKTGQECIDSLECADQCCRPKRLGRMGFKLSCGKPDENTACVGRVFSPNDIYNGY